MDWALSWQGRGSHWPALQVKSFPHFASDWQPSTHRPPEGWPSQESQRMSQLVLPSIWSASSKRFLQRRETWHTCTDRDEGVERQDSGASLAIGGVGFGIRQSGAEEFDRVGRRAFTSPRGWSEATR
jgi:hypothetical protein